MRHRLGRQQWVDCLVLAGLVLKQMVELPRLTTAMGLAPVVRALPGAANFQVARYAHWSGLVAGVACAAATDAIASLRARGGATLPRPA